MHRCTITIAPHKNPVRLLTFGGGGEKIRSLIMLTQYCADFLIAVAPKKKEKAGNHGKLNIFFTLSFEENNTVESNVKLVRLSIYIFQQKFFTNRVSR